MAFVSGLGFGRIGYSVEVRSRRCHDVVCAKLPAPGSTLPDSNLRFAYQFYQDGDSAKASKLIKAYLATKPGDWKVWMRWAEYEHQFGSGKHALEILKQSVEMFPQKTVLWRLLAGFQEQNGNRRAALAVYKHGVEKAGECPQLMLPWAVLETEQGRLFKAREIFERVTELAPTDRYTYQLWGFMELNAANDVDAARKIYVRGTKLCPNAACLWRALADLEDREAHPIEAQKYFCEAAMADPRDPCIWHAWGCMEERRGKIDRAQELFEQGIVVAPAFGPLWLSWGQMMERHGNIKKARYLYRRGSVQDTNNLPLLRALTNLEKASTTPTQFHPQNES